MVGLGIEGWRRAREDALRKASIRLLAMASDSLSCRCRILVLGDGKGQSLGGAVDVWVKVMMA